MVDKMAKIREDTTFKQRARRIKVDQTNLSLRLNALKVWLMVQLAGMGIKPGGYIIAQMPATNAKPQMPKPSSLYFRIENVGVYHDDREWTFALETHRCFGKTAEGNIKLGAYQRFGASDKWDVATVGDLPTITIPHLVRNAGAPVKPAFCVVKDDGQRAEE